MCIVVYSGVVVFVVIGVYCVNCVVWCVICDVFVVGLCYGV